MKNMKKKYIKPVSEVITVFPTVVLQVGSPLRLKTTKNNGLFDMYRGKER